MDSPTSRFTPVLIAMLGAILLHAQPPLPAQVTTTSTTATTSTHAARSSVIVYEDATAAAGLSGFRHVSEGNEPRRLVGAAGSGVAIWDFDNDGRLVPIDTVVDISEVHPQRRRIVAGR